MNKNSALGMAEALSTDCITGFNGLGTDSSEVIEHCWDEIEALRRHIKILTKECDRLRSELDEDNDVIR